MVTQIMPRHAGFINGTLQSPVLGRLKLEKFIFLHEPHVFGKSSCHQIKHQIETKKNP